VRIRHDSTKQWSLHALVDEAGDMTAQFERTIGIPVPFTMLHVGVWKQNLLLADHYGAGRVFLAGDAVHLVVPTGGLGMNTGVGDAIDLSWKLDETLRGWGGPNDLPSSLRSPVVPSICSGNMCRPPGRARGCLTSGCKRDARCTTRSATAIRCCGWAGRTPTRAAWSGRCARCTPRSTF